MLLRKLIFIKIIAALMLLASAGVWRRNQEALILQEGLGLYNDSDKVVLLTGANFNETVLEQNHAMLVEFYNTYCGHCKRFAPVYKEFAEQMYPWYDVLHISAIDCAADENNEVCRQYEIMGYPTLRYISPGFKPTYSDYGRNIDSQNPDKIRSQLATLIANENPANINNTAWPNLQLLNNNESIAMLYDNAGNQRDCIIVVYEPENSTIGIETALYMSAWPSVQVRRTHDSTIAAEKKYLVAFDRVGHALPITIEEQFNAKIYAEAIEEFLNDIHITKKTPSTFADLNSSTTPSSLALAKEEENKRTLLEVKKNKHLVYQADLELAIYSMLFNEIPKVNEIKGERLLALQRFMTVIKRYNPLGQNGQAFIQKLYEYILQFNDHLTGAEYAVEVKNLLEIYKPVFSAKNFVGCTASKPGLRGFTCSLWQLFHYLTIAAARDTTTTDQLEVLRAMHGYIKNFFGCTNCAEHFQAMAAQRKIWNVPSKDEAVLWLWGAHNEVNNRLAGDSTEDPAFPKIQFPSKKSCIACYNQPEQMVATYLDINWNKSAVLSFLMNIYNPNYISHYGLQNDEIIIPAKEQIRQKRQITSVFSDMDMRMGMLLYAFCITMMVVAFKLFAYKGYRKKPYYTHDALGKM